MLDHRMNTAAIQLVHDWIDDLISRYLRLLGTLPVHVCSSWWHNDESFVLSYELHEKAKGCAIDVYDEVQAASATCSMLRSLGYVHKGVTVENNNSKSLPTVN
jgi:hypothetical protein